MDEIRFLIYRYDALLCRPASEFRAASLNAVKHKLAQLGVTIRKGELVYGER